MALAHPRARKRALSLLPSLLLAAPLFLASCAHPPMFVRRSRVLRWMYRPATMPYLDNPRFSLEYAARWRGPEEGPNGVKFEEPKGRASISVVFLEQNKPGWKTPEAFRQYMREQGTVSDSHTLYEVEVSSRQGDAVRFTTYYYSQEYMLGAKFDVLETELVMVPDSEGLYVIRYDTQEKYFRRFHRAFENLLRSVTLVAPKEAEQ